MNKYFSKSLISYFIAFIFVFISIKLCWKPEYYELIKNIKITHLSVVILFTFVLNVIAGVSMSHISKTQYNIRLDSLDKIALSLMMNFWGYIIPLKGGVLFSAFYLKSKYNIKLVEGTSIAIFIYIVNLTIFGFFGLILFLTGQLQNIYLLLCAIVLIFTNPLLNLFHKISQLKIAYNITTIKKIQTLINSVIKNSQTSWKTPHTLIVIGGLIILRILFISIRYYWATLVFNVHIPFVQLMVLTIVIELSSIFLKFSPGNLGIFELLSGTTIGFMGNDMGIGILLALLCRATNLMLTFTLGLGVMFINFKYLKIVSLKALWEKVYVSA